VKRNLQLSARFLVCAAAVAGSASVAVVTVPGTASAATPLTVTCTKLTGNQTTQKITGCSGTGKSETGTSGTTKVASNDKSATITWATKKTSIESFTYKSVTPNACPAVSGYTKLLEVNETGSVTGGTATGMKGGKVSGKVCIYKKGSAYLVNSLGPQKI
jgi:hypothetical protein